MVNYQRSLICCLWILLTACAQTKPSHNQKASERILVASQNPAALIAHYKKQLTQNSTPCTRFLLAQAYFNKADYETALFHLNVVNKLLLSPQFPLTTEQANCTNDLHDFATKVTLQRAKSYYQLDQSEQALAIVKRMLTRPSVPGEALNLHGVLLSDKGEYKGARAAFNQARAQLYNDKIVNNNLAILDIADKNYQRAIAKLLPLFNSFPKDKRIKANLVLAMAKSQQFKPFKALLINEYNYEEVLDLYLYLKDENQLISSANMTMTEGKYNNED